MGEIGRQASRIFDPISEVASLSSPAEYKRVFYHHNLQNLLDAAKLCNSFISNKLLTNFLITFIESMLIETP